MSTRTSTLTSIDGHAAVPTWAVARPRRSGPRDADLRSTTDDDGVHDPTARGDRLLDRPPVVRRRVLAPSGATRRIALRLLAKIEHGHLEVVDTDGRSRTFGPSDAELRARIEIRDGRAWSAAITGGSVGYGRGFVEGWWHSDDPTTVTRILIRNLGRVDDLRTSWARLTGAPRNAVARLMPRTTRRRNRDDIMTHYDIGNEFFAMFLDETMTYSSAVFSGPGDTLAEASTNKYRRLLEKLAVSDGHSLLEIGSGWGGLAVHAARSRGCAVTTTTISAEQHHAVRRRTRGEGVEHLVDPLELDWRDLPTLGRRFDRVVSIEMIEAVEWRDYRTYFDTIERCLAPDGMVGMQAICLPDRRFQASKFNEDFIRRFVFPGGMLPSTGALIDAACTRGRLQLLDVEDLSSHYAETLRRWRHRFDEHLDEIGQLGLDDRFCRLWRMYLAYCEAAFHERHCTVQQLVFVGPEWRGGLRTRTV